MEWHLRTNGQTWTVTVDDDCVVTLPQQLATTRSPREMVMASLEKPFQFEPLRRALTPDDHIALVIDERLPYLVELICSILDYLAGVGIDPDAVTLLTSDPTSRQAWIDDLPDEYADVRTEVHNPADRKKLAYLATTKAGVPVYLNRTLVEADFIVVLSAHRFDDHTGERWLVPGLSDCEHQKIAAASATANVENESIWLLGTPFFVRVIEGSGGTIHEIVAGLTESNVEANRLRDARWQSIVKLQPATVIVTCDTARFDDLAASVENAERVVTPGGRIVILMNKMPHFPDAVEVLRIANEPVDALKKLRTGHPVGWRAAAKWAETASHAALFIAGPMSQEECEELFATSISSSAELQRLLDGGGNILSLNDAHLSRVVYRKPDALRRGSLGGKDERT